MGPDGATALERPRIGSLELFVPFLSQFLSTRLVPVVAIDASCRLFTTLFSNVRSRS